MATKDEKETNGCTFQWKIKNVNHCLCKHKEFILSPAFVADTLEATKWKLWLYPKGYTDERNISLYLRRETDCNGPDIVEVNYKFALLDKDGSFLGEMFKSEKIFYRGEFGDEAIESREKIFFDDTEAFLPEDTLTVQCAMWKKDETPVKLIRLSVLTVFKVNRRSFVWKIDEFSKVKSGIRTKCRDGLIDFDLVLNEIIDFVKRLDIEIISLKEQIKKFSIKISIINSEQEKEECGRLEYFACDLKKGTLPMPLFSKMLLEKKTRYLSRDELLLDCEYVTTDGTVLYEFCSYGIISSNAKTVVGKKEPIQQMPDLVSELKAAYNDGIHSDIELRTSTKTYPVHKFILSARSPVFKRMFSSDMREKNSGHVDVTDLEDETVHQMLQYLYTDTLGDLKLETAYKLYAAADKYQIMSLRSKCSSFMEDNLIPAKACAFLSLADLHCDDGFKKVVQDYILKHDQEVFGSQEWKHFMDTNPKLAAYIMFQKVFPQ